MLDHSLRLRKAIIDGNILIVNRLLKRFPDLLDNIDSQNGWSNLHYAAYYNRYEISEVLLKLIYKRYQNMNFQFFNDDYSSNSSKRSFENLKTSSYSQITSEEEIKLTFNKDTVIHLACRTNAHKTLQLMLSYFNVCIDQRYENGSTATHICSLHNFQESLQVLLENGAYPNIQDDDGNTPLHLALQFGHIKCADLLLSYKANDEMLNNAGWKPIDIAYSDEIQVKYLQIKTKPHSIPMHTSFSSSTVNSVASTHRLQSPASKINLPTIQSRKFSISSSVPSEDEYGENPGFFDYDSDIHSLGTSNSSKNTRSSSPLISAGFLNQSQPSNSASVAQRSSSTQNLQNIPENIINGSSNIERRQTLSRKPPSMTISIPSNPTSTIATQITPTSTNTNTPRKPLFHPIVTPNSKRSSMSTRTFRSNSLVSENNISPNKSITASLQQTPSYPSPRKNSSTSTISSSASSISQNIQQQQQQTQTQIQAQTQTQTPSQVPKPRKKSISLSNGSRPFLKSFSSTSELSSQQPISLFMKTSGRTVSCSSDIDEATSKLNDFKLQNENRVKLGMKLDTMVNKSQDSLVLESPIDKPPLTSTPTLTSLMSPTGLVFSQNKDTYRFPSPSLGSVNGSSVTNSSLSSGIPGSSYKSKVLSIPIASLKARRSS